MQGVTYELVEPLVVNDQGDLVKAPGIRTVDDASERHVGEPRDLALQVIADRLVAAAHDGVRLDTGAAELGHRVLSGLGLVLSRWGDERHQGHVDVADVGTTDVQAELPDGLQKREDLDIADCAAHLGDEHVHVVAGQHPDPSLDLVGDVRDDLNRLA